MWDYAKLVRSTKTAFIRLTHETRSCARAEGIEDPLLSKAKGALESTLLCAERAGNGEWREFFARDCAAYANFFARSARVELENNVFLVHGIGWGIAFLRAEHAERAGREHFFRADVLETVARRNGNNYFCRREHVEK